MSGHWHAISPQIYRKVRPVPVRTPTTVLSLLPLYLYLYDHGVYHLALTIHAAVNGRGGTLKVMIIVWIPGANIPKQAVEKVYKHLRNLYLPTRTRTRTRYEVS